MSMSHSWCVHKETGPFTRMIHQYNLTCPKLKRSRLDDYRIVCVISSTGETTRDTMVPPVISDFYDQRQ